MPGSVPVVAPEEDELPELDDELLLEPEDEPLDDEELDDDDAPEDDDAPDDDELPELDVELLVELNVEEADDSGPSPQADRSIEKNIAPDKHLAAAKTFLRVPARRSWVD